MRYLVQFPAGLAPLVGRALTGLCDGFTEVYADDSALVFDSSTRFAAVDEIELAKNLFVVWATAGRPPQAGGRALDRAVGRLSDSVPAAIRPTRPDPAGFRTMVQIDGQLTPVDRSTRDRLEVALASRTGQRVQSRGGNTEYWVMGRRDHAELMLLQRLPRRRKAPGKAGTLSPELAAALVLASDPRPTDTVLDPFAGSGALLLARSRRPSRGLVYGDHDLSALRPDLPESLTSHRRTRLLSDDALALPSLDDASVDAVITDPPWGEYAELDRPHPDFAAAMAASLARVLVDHGRLVVLVNRANTDVLTAALAGSGLDPDPPLQILVNGHPASVLVAVRRPRTMD
jgi:hypothetical protein